MILCHCAVVNDETVERTVDSGAKTLAQVCRSTGAGQDCGCCVFSLKRFICEYEEASVTTAPEVDGAAS